MVKFHMILEFELCYRRTKIKLLRTNLALYKRHIMKQQGRALITKKINEKRRTTVYRKVI